MTDLSSLQAILYSRKIDSSTLKPYTNIHLNNNGDLILSTPSLDSYRVINDPLHKYESKSHRLPDGIDHRILAYDSLESQRYEALHMKQPVPRYVTRVFQERFGSVVSPRSDPSKTIRAHTAPGYRVLNEHIPTNKETMISQRFNKINPFVTEKTKYLLRESVA